MPPKGRKKAAVTKSYSAEVDAEFPPIEKILEDKSQPAKSGRGRKKADVADDETIIVGQVGIVEEGADVGNGISNGTKMNGGGTPNNQEKMDPFDRLLMDSTTKKDDWRLEFSPDASRMSPKNGAEKESGDLESDEGDFKSNSKTSSVVAEAGSTRAKEEIEQVSDEEVEDAPEEAEEESEEVLDTSSDKKAVEKEIAEAQEEDEPEEPNVEVEKVPEKRGRKKAVEKAAEEDIEEVEKTEEPEKAVGRRGRKKAEVVTEEPKKVLAKRGRKKAEVVDEQEEIDEDEPEEEKPTAKRGRKKAEIPEEKDEVDDDDEMEEEEIEKPVTKRGRKKLEDVEKEKTEEEEPPKSKRGRKKAEVLDIADEESEKEQEKPGPKRGRRKAEAEAVEIADEKSEEEEHEKPKGRRGRPAKAAEIQIEDSQEPEKPRATRGRKKAEVVEAEEEKPVAKRGRKKAEVPEVAEEPEKTTGKRGRKKAEVVEMEIVEEPAKGKKGRKRKVDVPESPSKRGKEDYDEDDISDFAGKELRVAMTRNQEIDEMARKASPPHKETGKVQKPSDETFVMAKPAKEQPAKSGRKRANQDATDAKPEKSQKEEPAKQGKSGAKRAQIPDVSSLDFGSDAKTTDDQPWNFKIASWNVNGVRAWLEKNGMSYLTHEDPDVLCIQETKCSKDKLPEELQIDGYHCHWLAGDKEGYSGVGLISKTKPVSITEGIGIEEHDNEGRVITAEFEKFYLVNTYVPNSGRGLVRLDYRKTWDEDFRDYLKKLDEKKPVVLCGDLNVAHEEIDIANPKSNKKNAGFTQEERDGFSALLEEGFIDTFRHLYPDEKGAYTFWTYMMNCRAKNVGWRLDYFVISERFKDHLCDSLIRKDVMGSDHCPVGLLLHI